MNKKIIDIMSESCLNIFKFISYINNFLLEKQF